MTIIANLASGKRIDVFDIGDLCFSQFYSLFYKVSRSWKFPYIFV